MKLNAPLLDAVNEYRKSSIDTFHMPGHRFGKGIPEEFSKNALDFDVTEVPGTDNLHNPEGPIKEASFLAARLFGAKSSYFLVNGSTVGIHAMIMAACKPGDKLLVPRNCHQSVLGGMMLAGAEPVYMRPVFVEALGVPGGVSPKDVEQALQSTKDTVGALITSPTYYGLCPDIKKISDVLHSSGKILMVDEAHGAHFCFSERLPYPALRAGADVCVQSAHKTLPAVTSAALLHIGSDRIVREKMESMLEILQTSSPSYITMVSIDAARAMLENEGETLFEDLLEKCCRFREKLNRSGILYCAGKELIGASGGAIADVDLTRLVINVERTGKTGYEFEYILRDKYRIQIEMSDLFNIVCIPAIADSPDKFQRLLDALEEIARESGCCCEKAVPVRQYKDMFIPRTAIKFKDVFYMESEKVKILEANGRVCKGRITPYPPGIPAVCPGEIIESRIIEYLLQIRKSGGKIMGLDKEGKIDVVKE